MTRLQSSLKDCKGGCPNYPGLKSQILLLKQRRLQIDNAELKFRFSFLSTAAVQIALAAAEKEAKF